MTDTWLMPCPWCGKVPTLSTYPYSDHVACENPECQVRPHFGLEHEFCKHDYQKLVDAWNRRGDA